MKTPSTAVLIGQCPDQPGLVAQLSNWIFEHGGNILQLNEHVDTNIGHFFVRIHWDLETFDIAEQNIEQAFAEALAEPLNITFSLSLSTHKPKMAIFVSRSGHCIWDLLARHQSGELSVEIPLIISNHQTYRDLAERFEIPYHVIPKTSDNKAQCEQQELELLAAADVDLVVLARYMQVLSDKFVSYYPSRIINIHHSFLPAFAGARPYHRAFERGVKLIGATAHYVTSDLDEGPIIEQETARVSHKDTVADLIRRGRDLEKIVLARAVQMHVDQRLAVHAGRTLVF